MRWWTMRKLRSSLSASAGTEAYAAFWDDGTKIALRRTIISSLLIERNEEVQRAEIALLYGETWFASPIYHENEVWLLERADRGTTGNSPAETRPASTPDPSPITRLLSVGPSVAQPDRR